MRTMSMGQVMVWLLPPVQLDSKMCDEMFSDILDIVFRNPSTFPAAADIGLGLHCS